MFKRAFPMVFFLIIPLIFSGCGKKIGMKGLKLDIQLKPDVITDFLFVTMDYSYTVDPEFAGLSKNYQIFTHLWRTTTKEMLLVDDHMPKKPTSQWKAGDTIHYSRTFFIPKFLNEFDIDFEGYEEIKLSVGFYIPGSSSEEEPIPLFEKKINIQPASVNAPEIVYHTGWEELETDMQSNDPFYKSWRWTGQSAVCIVDNQQVPYTFKIRGGVNKGALPDQKVIIRINEQVLDEFIPEESMFSKEYTIEPEMMGNDEEFQLKIETDKTFVPARIDPNSRDNRELGLQVFFLYLRENAK